MSNGRAFTRGINGAGTQPIRLILTGLVCADDGDEMITTECPHRLHATTDVVWHELDKAMTDPALLTEYLEGLVMGLLQQITGDSDLIAQFIRGSNIDGEHAPGAAEAIAGALAEVR